MKKILSIILLVYSILGFGQLQVHTMNITANDLVYDAITNKIYASIPSSNGSNGNSIGVINPSTRVLENTIFMGSEPSVLAISDNGQYIYSGFSGTSTVRRFNIASQTAGIQYSLGSDTWSGSYYVEDIEVMPGYPETIAVSRRNVGYSPRHEGVAIYDDNIMRPTTTPDHSGSNKIEFTSQNSLIGYNNESTEYGIRRLSVNSAGVTNVSVTQSVLSNFYLDFIYHDNRMYATDGKVVDVTAAPFVSGQFANVSGPVTYDTYYNKVCFASYDYSGNITFKRFNPNTFLITDNLPITQSFGTVKSIITCGNGCYAFNTADNKIIIINDSTLGSFDKDVGPTVTVFPNPTSDFVQISSDAQIIDVKILDINGRVINDLDFANNTLDLRTLSSGIYIAQMSDGNGAVTTKKIIKK